jgi:hypothetical protein
MKYILRWLRPASDALAEAWVDSPSELRDEITSSVAVAEAALRTHPLEAGESRADGRRMLIVLPIAITYLTIPDDMRVNVEAFRLIRPHSP